MYDASKDPNYVDHLYLGKIQFTDPGLCSIEVYGNECMIPHFHIIGDNFECCPCIYEPLYFNHGNKNDKLSNKDLKTLDNWLREQSKFYTQKISNWESICVLWHQCDNPTKLVPKNPVQPHYVDMINMRG